MQRIGVSSVWGPRESRPLGTVLGNGSPGRVSRLCLSASLWLFALSLALFHSRALAAPPSLELQDVSSEEGAGVTGVSAKDAKLFSDTAKHLLRLGPCFSDGDCFGEGRRCFEGSCLGFAGPQTTLFKCSPGEECFLPQVAGSFYSDPSRESRFFLLATRDQLYTCGGKAQVATETRPSGFLGCLDGASDCPVFAEESSSSSADERSLSSFFSSPVPCTFASGGDLKLSCAANLGVVPLSVGVGVYSLCGCSATDLQGRGVLCASPEDFAVPVGVLQIVGFSELAEKASASAVEKASSETQKREAPRQFRCEVGQPCLLQSIEGQGLDSEVHFLAVLPGRRADCDVLSGRVAAGGKAVTELPCFVSASNRRCSALLSGDLLEALLVDDGKEAPQSEASLCGCSRPSSSRDGRLCLRPVLVGHLKVEDGTLTKTALSSDHAHHGEPSFTAEQTASSSRVRRAGSSQRRLQFINEEAANERREPSAAETGDGASGSSGVSEECKKDAECLSGFGRCLDGKCSGFVPDEKGSRRIKCVENFNCDARPGDLPTRGSTEGFQLIAIAPEEECGKAVNIKAEDSEHRVEGLRLCGCVGRDLNGDGVPCNHQSEFLVPLGRVSVQECITNAHCADKGLAYCLHDHCGGLLLTAAAASLHAFSCVRNKDCTIETAAAQGVKEALKVIPIAAHFRCGDDRALDPNYLTEQALPCVADVDADGKCDIHLGVNSYLGTQRLCGCRAGEDCTSLSAFGEDIGMLTTVECVAHEDCPLHSACVKAKCTNDDLPPRVTGSVPSSADVGPLTSFDLLFNEDILFGRPGSTLHIKCKPRNPRGEKSRGRRGGADPEKGEEERWEIVLPEDAHQKRSISHSSLGGSRAPRLRPFAFPEAAQQTASLNRTSEGSAAPSWQIERHGQRLRITPEANLAALPEGLYTVWMDFGFVTDLAGNSLEETSDAPVTFVIARDADCPRLYVTGFSTDNGNVNGAYVAIDPVNRHAAWRGGEGNLFFVYWREAALAKAPTAAGGGAAGSGASGQNASLLQQQPGNWIVDVDLDEEEFLAFADLGALSASAEEGLFPSLVGSASAMFGKGAGSTPPSGKWHKWSGTQREPQPFVQFFCSHEVDLTPPLLLAVEPPSFGEVSPSSSSAPEEPHSLRLDPQGIPVEPIRLVFDKPVNFGHWASVRLLKRSDGDDEEEAEEQEGREEHESSEEESETLEGASAGERHRIAMEWVVDQEAGMRGEGKGIEVGRRPKPPGKVVDGASPEYGLASLFVTKPLSPNAHYDLIADLGSFTDLSYNPWGPLRKATVSLVAAPPFCAASQGLGPLSQAAADSLRQEGWTEEEADAAADSGSYLLSPTGEFTGKTSELPEGALASARCRSGFSAVSPSLPRQKEKPQTEPSRDAGTLRCSGGLWTGRLLPCLPLCGKHPLADSPSYLLKNALDGGSPSSKGLPGEELVVECAVPVAEENAEGQEEEGLSTSAPPPSARVKCVAGKWTATSLKCNKDCAPLQRLLGPNYRVFKKKENTSERSEEEAVEMVPSNSDELRKVFSEPEEEGRSSGFAVEGEERLISCREPALAVKLSGAEEEEGKEDAVELVKCSEEGWTPRLSLQCRRNCEQPPETPEGADVEGESLQHGAEWKAVCKPGYVPAGKASPVLVCDDGRWRRGAEEGPSLSRGFACTRACAPPQLSRAAYRVTFLNGLSSEGEEEETFDAAEAGDGFSGNVVKIECLPGAKRAPDSPESETLRCEDGSWGLQTVRCSAPCQSPLSQLGSHYAVVSSTPALAFPETTPESPSLGPVFSHGAEASVRCAEGSAVVSGDAEAVPFPLVCVNGVWVAKNPQSATREEARKGEHEEIEGDHGISLRCARFCRVPELPVHLTLAVARPHAYAAKWKDGESLSLRCSDAFSSRDLSAAEQQGVGTSTLVCRDGEWQGSFPSGCARPCGGDGDEEEFPSKARPAVPWEALKIPCGGVCPEEAEASSPSIKCGSCFNGIKDPLEEGVDCGGPFCSPCRNCSPLPLKPFLLQPQLFEVRPLSPADASTARGSFTPRDATLDPLTSSLVATAGSPFLPQQTLHNSVVQVTCKGGSRVRGEGSLSSTSDERDRDRDRESSARESQRGRLTLGGLPLRLRCADGLWTAFPDVAPGESGGEDFVSTEWMRPPSWTQRNSSNSSKGSSPSAVLPAGPLTQTQDEALRASLLTNCVPRLWKTDFGGGGASLGLGGGGKTEGKSSSRTTESLLSGLGHSSSQALRSADLAAAASPPLRWRGEEFLAWGAPLLRGAKEDKAFPARRRECLEQLGLSLGGVLAGECGALAFGASDFKTASFCRGGCSSSLKAAAREARRCLDDAEPTKELGAASDKTLPGLVEELDAVFCQRQEGAFCFAKARDTFAFLERLHDSASIAEEFHRRVCSNREADAGGALSPRCFRSNARYPLLLQRLGEVFDLQLPRQSVVQLDAEASLLSLTGAGLGGEKLLEEGLLGAGTRGFIQDLRRLPDILEVLCLEVEGVSCTAQVLKVAASNPLERFQSLSASAASSSLSLGGSGEGAEGSLADSEVCSSGGAATACHLEAMRRLGQLLLQPAKRRFLTTSEDAAWEKENEAADGRDAEKEAPSGIHPYDLALGLAMRVYGRTFCQRSASNATCGSRVFPVSLGSQADLAYKPATRVELPLCECPLAFVGDGECDASCNTAACDFDRGDCSVRRMMPGLVSHLQTQTLSPSDACFPFRADFACSSAKCRGVFREMQKQQGCCLATQLELLRELLALDEQSLLRQHKALLELQRDGVWSPQLQRLQQKLQTQLKAVPALVFDRSTPFLEADCQLPLDRSCSRGLSRLGISIAGKIVHAAPKDESEVPPFDSLEDNPQLESSIRLLMRDAMAAALALPTADVQELRFWKGSVVFNAVADAGWLVNKSYFLERLTSKEPKDKRALAKALEDALNWRLDMALEEARPRGSLVVEGEGAESRLTNQVLKMPSPPSNPTLLLLLRPPVSVVVSSLEVSQVPLNKTRHNESLGGGNIRQSLIPPYGTWGLGSLRPASVDCLNFDGLSAPPGVSVFEAYKLSDASKEHGSTMTVSCGAGYEALEGSSPQSMRCSQGRWVAVSQRGEAAASASSPAGVRALSNLLCRMPCPSFEVAAASSSGAAFVVSGVGVSEGDSRTLQCAPGFKPADASGPRVETVECKGGVWQTPALRCLRDLASEASPCVSALAEGLPSHLQAEGVSILGTPRNSPQHAAAAAEMEKALRREGLASVQVFRVSCGRGFVPGASAEGLSATEFVACLDGELRFLGAAPPVPHTVAQELHSQLPVEFAQDFRKRLLAASKVKLAASSPAESSAAQGSEEEDAAKEDEDATLLGVSLDCQRDLRVEPSPPPRPLSDTLLVFLSLLLLFVAVVAMLIVWWLCGKRQQKRDARRREEGNTRDSDNADGFSSPSMKTKEVTQTQTQTQEEAAPFSDGQGSDIFASEFSQLPDEQQSGFAPTSSLPSRGGVPLQVAGKSVFCECPIASADASAQTAKTRPFRPSSSETLTNMAQEARGGGAEGALVSAQRASQGVMATTTTRPSQTRLAAAGFKRPSPTNAFSRKVARGSPRGNCASTSVHRVPAKGSSVTSASFSLGLTSPSEDELYPEDSASCVNALNNDTTQPPASRPQHPQRSAGGAQGLQGLQGFQGFQGQVSLEAARFARAGAAEDPQRASFFRRVAAA